MRRGPYDKAHVAGPKSRVTNPNGFSQALQATHYTYRSLAEALDCKRSTLNDIAKGRTGVSPAFARRVEALLEVQPGELFGSPASTTPDTPSPDGGHQQEAKHDEPEGTASQADGNQ